MSYILAIDQGTTSSRAHIFDKSANLVASSQKEITQYFPKPSYVEHDPEEIYESQVHVILDALNKARLNKEDIKAVGITNQRETVVVWNKTTLKPVHNAIVWQDRRSAHFIKSLKEKNLEKSIQEKTGLLLDPYFSASKLAWILDNYPEVKKNPSEYAFGTIDSFLISKLTAQKYHITDVTNASRTQLFNIHTKSWDDSLLKVFDIPRELLPEVVSNHGELAEISALAELKGLGIYSCIGDQQAALFGSGCLDAGEAKCTYGTGCFILVNTGNKPVHNKNLLSTIAFELDGKTSYALEGSVFMGGAIVKWLRDELGMIETSSEIETLAKQVKDTNDVYFIPSFTGLGAPYWDPFAKGVLLGLTRGTNKSHIARAILESIALQVCDIFEIIHSSHLSNIRLLKADGGASKDRLLMQMQADFLQAPILLSKSSEQTALGAALLAGYGAKMWNNLENIIPTKSFENPIEPKLEADKAKEKKDKWKKAVQCALLWSKLSN